jgi:hypothetical protein
LCTPLPSSIRATCPAHLILLHFITRTILGEEYRSLSSSLCNYLHSPVNPSLLGPNILLNTLFTNTLSLWRTIQYNNLLFITLYNTLHNIYNLLFITLAVNTHNPIAIRRPVTLVFIFTIVLP